MQEESEAVDFSGDLPRLACPVLVLRGARSDFVPPRWEELYRSALPCGEVVTVDTGQDVFQPPGCEALAAFLARQDAAVLGA